MICDKCGRIYIRVGRKKGTRRDGSKICPKCKKRKCVICKRIMVMGKSTQLTCSKKCRDIRDVAIRKKNQEKYRIMRKKEKILKKGKGGRK